jgi:hypothetical protein
MVADYIEQRCEEEMERIEGRWEIAEQERD